MNDQAFQQVSQNSPEVIPTTMRRIEGREWWLWGFAVAVTLALTLGIVSFTFPWFNGCVGWQRWYYSSISTPSISTCNSTAFDGSWRSEISFFSSSVKMPPT